MAETMPTCGTCKHWAEYGGNDGEPQWGVCNAIVNDSHGVVATLRILSPYKAPASALPADGWLQTRSDFGCNLWEAA